MNIVFNFKTVVDHNPILKRDLHRFDVLREQALRVYTGYERAVYLVIILLILICTISMKYTNKLNLENKDGSSTDDI